MGNTIRRRVSTLTVAMFFALAYGFGNLAIPASAGANRDSDHDGMPNRWEHQYGLNTKVNDARLDPDQDTLDNIGEFQEQTDPTDEDSDDDGVEDGTEIDDGTDPGDEDSDDDGIEDGNEDTDEDGIDDEDEDDAADEEADSDEDGIDDEDEDDGQVDTDDDGVDDDVEDGAAVVA